MPWHCRRYVTEFCQAGITEIPSCKPFNHQNPYLAYFWMDSSEWDDPTGDCTLSSDNSDEFWTDSESEPDGTKAQRKNTKRKSKFSMHKVSLANPKCFLSPQGTPCECKNLQDIDLLDVNFWKRNDGVNVILDRYDTEDPDKCKYFGISDDWEEFSIDHLTTLSTEELIAMKDRLEAELHALEMMDRENTQPTPIVCPFTGVKSGVAIQADVRTYNFDPLIKHVGQFDVILMDPPWKIQPTDAGRGVAIRYQQMRTQEIAELEINKLQHDGFLFMWVVARKMHEGIGMMMHWGYNIVGHINWEKVSSYGNAAPSHGYYLQHQKETCIVGRKGNRFEAINLEKFRDVIVTTRTHNQSEKPHELYEVIEDMFPNCKYLEIFARNNNIRDNWVSIGLDITK